MLDPVLLYSPDGLQTRRIPAVDAPGWMAAGWTIEPQSLPLGILPSDNFATVPKAEVVAAASPEPSSKRKKLVAAENDGDSLPES